MDRNDKSKIEGVDNKELKAFIAIIIVILILLIFEIFFFEGRSEVAEEMAKMEEQLQEIKGETVELEQKTVYLALNDIVTKMNNKDYKSLYDMLKEDYNKYYFRDYESFEKFIKVYAGQEYFPKYSSYYRDENFYYIMVDFLKSKYTREDLLSQRFIKVDTIVLEEQEDGNFKFAMNGFVENITHNRSKTIQDVTFTLQNSLRNTETMKTTVFVENNSNKIVTVNTSNLQPDILGGVSAKVSVSSSLSLEPGEVGTLTIEFYFQYNSGKEFRGLTITGAKFDDGTIIEDVFLAN